jgi:16S rRNA (cytosine967-C5)-methyltransferase
MTPAARIAAAIEILDDILTRRRPAPEALKDWGIAHRFAGSGDRAALASLVYDALRRRASAAALLGEESARAIMLGTLHLVRGEGVQGLSSLFSGVGHAPAALTDAERQAIGQGLSADLPAPVLGDFPEWLAPQLGAAFGDDVVAEGQGLAGRAPVDARVNTLKALRPAVMEELAHITPAATPWSPVGLRFAPRADGRAPSLQTEPAFMKGHFEIQDEGSQLVALLAGPSEGAQVLDLCAGGGGKTLEFAALMNNRGQIIATDMDQRRLAPIHERLARAGARNVQVRTPRGDGRGRAMPELQELEGRMDLVLVDAPCTGTGTWRRNPDAKWRVRPGALAERRKEQAALLDTAPRYVRPGGRLAYVTCSVLPDENDAQVAPLVAAGRFRPVPPAALAAAAGLPGLPAAARVTKHGLLLSPARTGTDGFYLSVLENVENAG